MRRKDPEETLDLFKPETEEQIKGPLAWMWAREKAFAEWKAKKEAAGEEIGYLAGWDFERDGSPGLPGEGEEVEFIPPIEFPDRKLCDEIHIVPSGTGLIEVYENDPDYTEKDIYGTAVARITTYSVSLVPKRPEDAELLRETVVNALKVLGDTPYKYELPGFNLSGESYKRVKPSGTEYGYSDYQKTEAPYVVIEDGTVKPRPRFDLDDLWVLYYILEPIIEPSEQIAAAMNAARFAEERGAVLTPDGLDYLGGGHEVADEIGYLKKSDPNEILADAVRDAFIDLALNKIDEAEFLARISTIADHTLTGQMVDPHGAFKTIDGLLEDRRTNKGNLITFEEARQERIEEILRCLVGLAKESDDPIYPALIRLVNETKESIRSHFRDKSKAETMAFNQALARKMREDQARWSGARSLGDILGERFKEREFSLYLSDAFAGRAKKDDDTPPEEKKGLSNKANLVVASSEVETCIDGIHAGGRYRSKTKGSPFVRKELPKALEPFCPQRERRAVPLAIMASPHCL